MEYLERCIDSKEIYSGRILRVYSDQVQLPNEQHSVREVVRLHEAVGVLAVTEENEVILVKQFRYPTGEALYEIPAGKLDISGESAEVAVLRELAEETPYTAQKAVLLQEFYSSPGFCDEKMYLFRAFGLKKNSTLSTDADEFVNAECWSKDRVENALQNHEIQDAKTIIALQHWLFEDR